MSQPTGSHGFERYERAKQHFDDSRYADAARELEELFIDLAAARAECPEAPASADPGGPGAAEAHLLLARAYFHSGQLSRAEAAARKVLVEAPDDSYAHLLLGRALPQDHVGDEARGPLRLAELLGGYTSPTERDG